ncbi:MAG TPA: hypothetical protein DCP37_10790 [Dehalococcoidia bacterium]|nr:hypothetical protein [Dehalococcoidia bacterium]
MSWSSTIFACSLRIGVVPMPSYLTCRCRQVAVDEVRVALKTRWAPSLAVNGQSTDIQTLVGSAFRPTLFSHPAWP